MEDLPPFPSGELPLDETAELVLGEEGVGFPVAEEEGELGAVEGVEREEVGLVEGLEASVIGGERLSPRAHVAALEIHLEAFPTRRRCPKNLDSDARLWPFACMRLGENCRDHLVRYFGETEMVPPPYWES